MPGATAQLNKTLAEAEKLVARASGATIRCRRKSPVYPLRHATLQARRKTLEETHGLISADTGQAMRSQGHSRAS